LKLVLFALLEAPFLAEKCTMNDNVEDKELSKQPEVEKDQTENQTESQGE